jgi:glycosidase
MAMAVLATVRGIPQLYYGSEIGMSGNKEKGDAAIRLDFPGGWKTDPNNAFNLKVDLKHRKNILILRPNFFSGEKTTAVHSGKMTHYIPETTYTYLDNDDNTVMIVLNNNKESTN